MNTKIMLAGVGMLVMMAGAVSAELVTKEVAYEGGGVKMKGYLAYDGALEGKRPGVLVVHEWWGHNDYARKRADMLAELGYVALAVDMYGEGKTADHPQDAGLFSSAVMENLDVAQARFLAAMDFLKTQDQTDANKIGAVGYCFGGGVVLHMARFGVDLDGVASFHGSLGTAKPAEFGDVKAMVLVCHGAEDQFVSEEQVQRFKQEMNSADARMRFVSYPGALHGFTNPVADLMGEKFGIPIGYNKDADKNSWEEMKVFFEKAFSDGE
jgi:dienelactone hydrolase